MHYLRIAEELFLPVIKAREEFTIKRLFFFFFFNQTHPPAYLLPVTTKSSVLPYDVNRRTRLLRTKRPANFSEITVFRKAY